MQRLSTEILYEIFECFEAQPITCYEDQLIEDARMQTIQSARLVSHRFCEAASRFLIPQLFVIRLTRQSLDTARQLLENPYISIQRREIEIMLQGYSEIVVNNEIRFALLRNKELEHMAEVSRCRCITARANFGLDVAPGSLAHEQFMTPEGYDEDSLALWGRYLDTLSRDKASRIFAATLGLEDGFGWLGDKEDEFHQKFHEGYVQYVKGYQDHLSMIQDGSFVNGVVACLAKVRDPIRINFTDLPRNLRKEPCIKLGEEGKAAQFLSKASAWSYFTHFPGTTVIAARIMSDLPIALDRAGVVIKTLYIRCMPRDTDHVSLTPTLGSWEDLKRAFRNLQWFSFIAPPPTYKEAGPTQAPQADLDIVQNYLSTAVSSPRLKYMHVDLTGYRSFEELSNIWELPSLGAIFTSVQSPQLVHAFLSHVSLRYAELKHLLQGNGRRWQHVDIRRFNLEDGSWRDVLDWFHNQFGHHERPVCLSDLAGQDMGTITLGWRGSRLDEEDQRSLREQIQQYINGTIGKNPL